VIHEIARNDAKVHMKFLCACATIVLIALLSVQSLGQGGVHTLFGDLQVDESKSDGVKPLLYEVILYNLGGTVVARQFVGAGGRYRFLNIANGQYELAVLLEHEEIGRTRVEILSTSKNDFRHDISLEWRPGRASSVKPGSISAADIYKRSSYNEKLFSRAKKATDNKRYDEAVTVLQQIVATDPKDFQALTELGTVYLFKNAYAESEKAYVQSIAERPTFFLTLLNLGKLRLARRNFAGAIEPLTAAVKLQPNSADANYYLGEAYLQIKKGSKAVGYLYESLRLDPVGKVQVHLRLAALYDAAGFRDKAATEFQEFLKKKPDYVNRTRLEQYIARNKRSGEQ
jgi:tetratricopeptide (TPR) repeat protein